MTKVATEPYPAARPPSEAALAAWLALSPREQRDQLRALLAAADAGTISDATMIDVLAAARRA